VSHDFGLELFHCQEHFNQVAAHEQVCCKCFCVAYCGREHQRQEWAYHKHACKSTAAQYTSQGWQEFTEHLQLARTRHTGLQESDQYSWLVHCYQMRIDDDMAFGGGNCHGLYDEDYTAESIARDFLIFCKLAVRTKMLPRGWSWSKCMECTGKHQLYAFEKSDAQQLYGSEISSAS
jgi:hypothetical protein